MINTLFKSATILAIFILFILLVNIINDAFGYVAIENSIEPTIFIESGNLDDLNSDDIIEILEERLSKGLVRRYNSESPLKERSQKELMELLFNRVIEPRVKQSWSLKESIFNKKEILELTTKKYPNAYIDFRAWLNLEFITKPQSSIPEFAGIRTAILGSLMIICITIFFAFPVGVASAIYLEEYAGNNRFTRFVQVNIYNLSGVPSIIFGLLGLAVFVRGMEPFTSGSMFGYGDPATANGRTILAAGLTLAILILPIIIINTQEALRAVPQTLRQAGYGIGGTKWQIIWSHVLPASIERIMTGTILAVSRAIGETAPIVVIGASTFISVDPSNIFSKFTTLPIQIYQWTSRPQAEFRNVAAAAIIVLLLMLLSMNTFAILIRNRIGKNRS
ncbi:phosphate ABC transporter permease PstA [Thiospirochaeta perfilievii]|uniref:Phosphate transport system permease protein PstA n=1 Tax=Thiospirochaeta perfilievii TaxID=252967 RepID=A0A5C1QCN0_9SPIO|nr:phosphate ABC transporter permease PstA [Thiospirochaeta perfilievii]QEN05088.1 phosphate ABC transporter permease PstA [Thiospirochaeta perfilievii]